jgi:hypothetical protein
MPHYYTVNKLSMMTSTHFNQPVTSTISTYVRASNHAEVSFANTVIQMLLTYVFSVYNLAKLYISDYII